MGRSQVKRNQSARGRGRGGRGGGAGGGGRGGREGGRRQHKAGVDISKLGDNSFRYTTNKTSSTSGGGDAYDGLLDDINFISSDGGFGEYYGDSHFTTYNDGEDELSSATAALALSNNKSNQQHQNEDWMTIDINALDKCLKQIPIHERLKIPRHIGKHLEDRYDIDGGGGGRKKTLAELREEAKCISAVQDEQLDAVLEKKKSAQVEKSIVEKEDSKAKRKEDASAGDVGDEEEEDLDAWLDDMIG